MFKKTQVPVISQLFFAPETLVVSDRIADRPASVAGRLIEVSFEYRVLPQFVHGIIRDYNKYPWFSYLYGLISMVYGDYRCI